MELQAGFHVHFLLDSFSVGFFWFELWLCILSLTFTLYKLVLSDFPQYLLLPKVQSTKPTSGAGGWHLNPYVIDGQSLVLGVQSRLLHEDLDA